MADLRIEVIFKYVKGRGRNIPKTVMKMTGILLLFFIQPPFNLKGKNTSAVWDRISSLTHPRCVLSV